MSSLNPNPNPKRKPTPQWATPTPSAASPAPSSAASEDGTPKKKTPFGIGQYGLTASEVPTGLGRHDATSMMLIVDAIKRRKTININDVGLMPELAGEEPSEAVLEMVKNHERIEYNEDNGVLEYRAELEVSSVQELISELKKKSHLTGGVSTKALKQSWPQAVPALEELEKEGKVLIMRGFPGLLNQIPLPPLGGKRMDGSTVMDGGHQRWKGAWWDEVKERGDGVEKMDEDFIHLWGEIQLKETDDVVELLRQHDFEASNGEAPAKPVAKSAAPVKKKRKINRVNQRVTNSHMKEFGVDFSKDYVESK